MKKFFAVIFALLFVFSCAKSKSEQPIRVFHWGDIIEMQNVNKIIKDIEKTKKIKVVQERAPAGNSYMEKFLTQAAAGMAPDIVFVEVGNVKPMVDRDLLVDLTPYIANDKDKDFNIKDYYPEVVDRFTVDGKLYVVPRDIAPICVIYYNKKLFDEAGLLYPTDDWTYLDFLSLAQKLTKYDKTGKPVQFGFLDEWVIWDSWVYSFGGAIVDDVKHPTKCVLDSPEAVQAVQFRADMTNKYKVAPSQAQLVMGQGWYGTASVFSSGKVAMFYTGYWKSGYFRSIKDFDWDIVMFPKGPKGFRKYSSGGSGYAITTQCKDKDKAWQVLKRFAGEKGQIDLSSQGGLQPAIIKLAESKQFLDDLPPKNKKIMLTAPKDIIFTPLMKEWEEINMQYLIPELDKVWSGQVTAEVALKKITKDVNKNYFSKGKEKK
ncbi:MAG: sugar ABC transporter substrate-binding protein [Candidatus Goldbacteria bacterium]|nr:sugar ABC transporter substrate-binding protein [Candidatus Goldiibacteriota bacterium]